MPSSEICKHCNTPFSSAKEARTSIQCVICRKCYHDQCVDGLSAVAIAEAKKPKSQIRYVCRREDCRKADAENTPLYSTSEMENVLKEEAEKLFEERQREEIEKLKKLQETYKKLQYDFDQISASASSSPLATQLDAANAEIAKLKAAIVEARKETDVALSSRRSSIMPEDPQLKRKISQLLQENNSLKKQLVDNIPNDLNKSVYEAAIGEAATLKQQNEKLQSEITVLNSKITQLSKNQVTSDNNDHVTKHELESLTNAMMAQISQQIASSNEKLLKKIQLQAKSSEAPSTSYHNHANENEPVKTFASVLAANDPECIRTIVIAEEGRVETLKRLREDRKCNDLGFRSVRTKAPGILSVHSNDASGAARLESYIIEKYQDKVQVRKPKENPAMIKIVAVPTDIEETQLIDKICGFNQNISADKMQLVRTYVMKGKRRDYRVAIVKCDLELQIELVATGFINFGFFDLRLFEHVELMSCAKCGDFGHSKIYCKNKAACRHCAGEHLVAECPNRESPPKCANCLRKKLPDNNHSPNSHFCKSRIDRIEGIKNANPKNANPKN